MAKSQLCLSHAFKQQATCSVEDVRYPLVHCYLEFMDVDLCLDLGLVFFQTFYRKTFLPHFLHNLVGKYFFLGLSSKAASSSTGHYMYRNFIDIPFQIHRHFYDVGSLSQLWQLPLIVKGLWTDFEVWVRHW